MIHVNWCFHPLEGIVLAAALFALYYWVIRLRCDARKAQTIIFGALLSVTLCTFTSLSLRIESDKATHTYQTTSQATLPYSMAAEIAADQQGQVTTATTATTSTPTAPSWNAISWLGDSGNLLWIYAAGIAVVAISFIVQLLWYFRIRRGSLLEKKDKDGVCVFTSPYSTPFSFFDSVFLPYDLDGDVYEYVMIHEKSHIRHRHFLKLCVMLLLVAVNWYNPIAWFFFNEMKMQQELEADSDVLAEGIDRHDYQTSLLKVCVQNSRKLMVQSAFSSKSLKQRVLFMNKSIRKLPSYLRLAACTMGLVLLFSTTMAIRAQISYIAPHHPLEGCWTMDFTRPANTSEELYPPFKQYAFYNHDTFFSPHFYKIDGINFIFGFSGEEVVMRGDTLRNAHGKPLVYRFVDDDTFQCDWEKAVTDNSLAQGEVITDQWSRATPSEKVLKAFHQACDTDQHRQKPFDGVWQQIDPSGNGGKTNSFLLVNGDMLMGIDYVPDPDTSLFRYSGSGISTEIIVHNDTIVAKMMKATIVMENDKSAVMHYEGNDKPIKLTRVPMPQHIRRMLATTQVILN